MAVLDLLDDLYSLPTQTLYRSEGSDECDDLFSQVPEPSTLLDEVEELFSQAVGSPTVKSREFYLQHDVTFRTPNSR